MLVVVVAVTTIVDKVAAHGDPVLAQIGVRNTTVHIDQSVMLAVSPKLLQTSQQWVTVSWEGVQNPSDGDWVGIYSPPVHDASSITPVKFMRANVSTTWRHGYGKVRFNLVNARSAYNFAFFQNGTAHPVLVSLSEDQVTFENPNEPLQGHIALTNDLSQMRVSWNTRDAIQPCVVWGEVGSDITTTTYAVSTTFGKSDLCGHPAIQLGYRDPGLMHTAVLEGLQPSTQYWYQFGDEYGFSDRRTFFSAPTPSPERVTRFLAYGDMGYGPLEGAYSVSHETEPSSLQTTAIVRERLDSLDFIVHFGDVSYARGYLAEWDAYMGQIEPIASAVPYMTGEGNHERDWGGPRSGGGSGDRYPGSTDSGGECGVPYYSHFVMPGADKVNNSVSWYSFDYGNVHVVVMSTEVEFEEGSPQYQWIEGDLRAVDRTATPWVVFTGHRPMYIDCQNSTSDAGIQPVAAELRTHIEPLFLKYRVNLAIWGHHHSFQVTCPVQDTYCSPPGEVWCVCVVCMSCVCRVCVVCVSCVCRVCRVCVL